jgi:hypothetical protein
MRSNTSHSRSGRDFGDRQIECVRDAGEREDGNVVVASLYASQVAAVYTGNEGQLLLRNAPLQAQGSDRLT